MSVGKYLAVGLISAVIGAGITYVYHLDQTNKLVKDINSVYQNQINNLRQENARLKKEKGLDSLMTQEEGEHEQSEQKFSWEEYYKEKEEIKKELGIK